MFLYLFERAKNKIKRLYRRGVFLDTIKSKQKSLYVVGDYTLINRNVTIGKNVVIYPNVMFFGQGPIVIGDHVNIGNGTILYASDTRGGGITIGDHVMIAAHCYIIDNDHGMEANINMMEQKDRVKKVIIGNDVWLGSGSKILKGSVIENGAVVGANAVVKHRIEENHIVAGVPAKTIGQRG